MRNLRLSIIGAVLALAVTLLVPSVVLALETNTAADNDNGSIVIQSVEGKSVGQKIQARAKTSWPWYVTRASGIVAAVTLVILMLSGIGQITGFTYRFLDPLTSWASHRALGLAFGVSVLLHIFSLLFDHFVTFNIIDLFIPWASNYKPLTIGGLHLGSLYVAFGVISFYLVWVIIVTSLLWVEKKPHIWKWIHLLSYIVLALVFVHTLFLGTDAHGILRYVWIGIALGIMGISISRLWRLRNI